MNTKTQQPKALQKRRLLVALPLLALPFLTLGFWALGGGKQSQAETGHDKGFNATLPNAKLDDKEMDKMAYYDKAVSDSLKRREQSLNDPYFQGQPAVTGQGDSNNLSGYPTPYGNGSGFAYRDPNEAKVYEKLGTINRALGQSTQQTAFNPSGMGTYPPSGTAVNSADIDRLEQMMRAMQSGNESTDPETDQLNGMLEKILDIQHPERVQEKIKLSEDLRKGRVFAVKPAGKATRISLLENSESKDYSSEQVSQPGFFGLDDTITSEEEQNAIEAVVHENQTLVNGSTVKLRLLDDINVKGTIVPKGTFVYGTAALEGERLTVKVKGLRFRKSLYPVQLSVFDIDGQDGIYIPGAIARDVAKQSTESSIQGIGLNSFDQSLGAQAAGAGIEAAKSFLSKKVKLIKVMVKAGYKVLLRDDKQKDE